jgi:hypothetical protein
LGIKGINRGNLVFSYFYRGFILFEPKRVEISVLKKPPPSKRRGLAAKNLLPKAPGAGGKKPPPQSAGGWR